MNNIFNYIDFGLDKLVVAFFWCLCIGMVLYFILLSLITLKGVRKIRIANDKPGVVHKSLWPVYNLQDWIVFLFFVFVTAALSIVIYFVWMIL